MAIAVAELAAEEQIEQAEVSCGELAQLLANVLPHAAKDNPMRPVLMAVQAVQITARGGNMTVTATDSYTLGQDVAPALGSLEPVLVAAKDARKVAAAAKKQKHGAVLIRQEGGYVVFELADARLHFPVVQGDYPNVEYLFGKEAGEPVTTFCANPEHLARFKVIGTPATFELLKGHKMRVTKGSFRGLLMLVRPA